jgi:hypothetical protein
MVQSIEISPNSGAIIDEKQLGNIWSEIIGS